MWNWKHQPSMTIIVMYIIIECSLSVLCKLMCDCLFWQAENYLGRLPLITSPPIHGDRLHQVFYNTMSFLENILAGYTLPNPYYKERLHTAVEILMKSLRDPALPLFEMQVGRPKQIGLFINYKPSWSWMKKKFSFVCKNVVIQRLFCILIF